MIYEINVGDIPTELIDLVVSGELIAEEREFLKDTSALNGILNEEEQMSPVITMSAELEEKEQHMKLFQKLVVKREWNDYIKWRKFRNGINGNKEKTEVLRLLTRSVEKQQNKLPELYATFWIICEVSGGQLVKAEKTMKNIIDTPGALIKIFRIEETEKRMEKIQSFIT